MAKFFRKVNGSIKYRIQKYLGIINESKSIYTKDFLREHKSCEIGEFTYGHPEVIDWGEGTKLKIGKFCSIAYKVQFFLGGNHRTDWTSTYPFNILHSPFPNAKKITGHPISKGDIEIGNDVWIGQNVVILSGVKISNGAVIGANSLVSKDVGPYEIVGGNPIKVLKKRFSEQDIIELEKIAWWDWPTDKINENIELICNEQIDVFIAKHKKI